MSTTGLDIFDRAAQKAYRWLDELSDEIGWDNRHRSYEAMGVVLRTIRDRLPLQEAVDLGAHLPLLIRGLYFQNWDVSRNPEKYRHRDDFIRRVRAEFVEHRTPAPVETIIRAVIRVVGSRMTEGQVAAVRRGLPPELREFWDVRGLPDERPLTETEDEQAFRD